MASLRMWLVLSLSSFSFAQTTIDSYPPNTLIKRASASASASASAPAPTSTQSPIKVSDLVCTEGNNELMGLNNNPSSWCFCNLFGPFATLPGSTTSYCNYKTMPTHTISLTTHSTVTNTECVVTTAIDTNAPAPTPTMDIYCKCGETMVPLNIATSSQSTTSYCMSGTSTTPAGYTDAPYVDHGQISWRARDCRSAYLNDTTIHPSDRWSHMFGDQAWSDAVGYWTANKNSNNGLSFIQTLSKYFNGPQNMQCGTVADKNNCDAQTPCVNGYFAAGWMVLESLRAVSDTNVNFYDALNNAETHITPNIGSFSGVFAPIDDSSKVLKTIVSFISLGFGIALGPVWAGVFAKFPYFAAANNPKAAQYLSQVKDTMGALVIAGTAITKDNTAAAASIATTNTLDTNMDGMVTLWQQSVAQLNTVLFNGSSSSIDLLFSMITDGKMLSGDTAISDLDAQGPIQKTVYGYMIPQAWSLSNLNIHPFIIDTGAACWEKPDLKYTQGQPLSGCSDDRLYYVVSVTGPSVSCTPTMPSTCDANPWTNVPGAGALDGTHWGGVKGDDFVQSALAGRAANNGKNGWALMDPVSAFETESDLLLSGNGIDLPGVNQFPICGEDEAYTNWNKGKSGPNYPCND